jgi:hypothetical protein
MSQIAKSKNPKAKKNGANKRKAKWSRSAKRTDKETAIALLKIDFGQANPPSPKHRHEAFNAFYEEMKERHNPELPIHCDIVQRATQLRWRLAKINNFEDQLFASLREVSDLHSPISLERRKQFVEFFEMMLRLDGLEKISMYEAALAEEVRKNNHELEEVEDWQHREGFKRGKIGYHVSQPIDSGMMLCYDEPVDRGAQRCAPPQLEAGDEIEPPPPSAAVEPPSAHKPTSGGQV